MTVQSLDAFQVIADPSRRKILQLLKEDSQTINDLAGNFSMSRPAISKHIKVLESTGFISIRNIGRERYCTLNQEGFNELQDWISFFDDFWKEKLGKLQRLLNERELGKKKG